MKPLRLTLAGLNSFREEQEINFAHLCQGNVFGIFGATGSGKSTIIDAITLALFGRVERAPGKVQGIINKSADSASVCFDFSLAGAEDIKTYRVERKYVSKEGSIACRLARISEITGGEAIVLADKISQVDAKVEEILGLTVDDFTRAVVLPQGKFAEFLSLKGTERREMLERIFNLGEYGEKLLAVASADYREIDAAIKAVQAEQMGLGDASSEALEIAQTVARQASSEVAELQLTIDAHNKHKEQARAVVELQQALAAAQLTQSQLAIEADTTASIEQRLSALSKALALEELVMQCDDAEQKHRVALEKSQAASLNLQAAQATERESIEALEHAAAARENKEPGLNALLNDLKRASLQENKLRETLGEKEKEVKILGKAQSILQALGAQLEEYRRRDKASAESLSALSIEFRKCAVTPEMRSAIEAATKSEADWKHALNQQQEVESELKQKLLACERSQNTLRDAQEKFRIAHSEHADSERCYLELANTEPPDINADQRELVGKHRLQLEQIKALWVDQERMASRRDVVRKRIIELEMQSSEYEKQLQQLKTAVLCAEKDVRRVDLALNTARQADMATQLARHLVSGAACPVCGSTEHPTPQAASSSSQVDELESRLQKMRSEYTCMLQEMAAKDAGKLALDKDQLDTAETLRELDNELRRIRIEIEGVMAGFPAAWAKLLPAELENRVMIDARQLEAGIVARNNWLSAINTRRQEERTKKDKLNLAQQALALAEQHSKALNNEVSVLTEKLEKVSIKTRELQDVHAQALLTLNTEDLAALKSHTASLDRRARELSLAHQDMEHKRSEIQAAIREIESNAAVEQEVALKAQTRIQGLQLQIAELTAEVNTVTLGRPVEEARIEAEAALSAIRAAEQIAQRDLAQARAKVESLGQEAARCAAQCQALEEARDKAAKYLNRVLEEAGFLSREAVVVVLADRLYQHEWESRVQEYRQRKTVAEAEVKKLTTALAGRKVSNEEWQVLEATSGKLKLAQEEALQRQGQAQARLADLEVRHLRFVELEQQKQGLVQERDLLQELVSLLRGNALVEFLATEHLQAIAGAATEWLRILTSGRYALEVDPEGGFVIRDDGNGGLKRPVHTLSGGETFVASLALALALSAQIQLRGRYPLEFFFLDEGFGTLDPELLEIVMTCLERMQGQHMSIGIISHVPELRERIQRKVLVTAAEPGGRGSRLKVV